MSTATSEPHSAAIALLPHIRLCKDLFGGWIPTPTIARFASGRRHSQEGSKPTSSPHQDGRAGGNTNARGKDRRAHWQGHWYPSAAGRGLPLREDGGLIAAVG